MEHLALSPPSSPCPANRDSMHIGHQQSEGYLCQEHTRQHENTAMETQGCIQDPAQGLLLLFLLPFSQALFSAICLGWQPLKNTGNMLPRRPTVTHLLEGAFYSPFLNGSNLRTFRIMIHEATLEELIAQHCKRPPLLLCAVLQAGALPYA